MAGRTPRFDLAYFGGTVDGSLGEDGGKFTEADRLRIDRVLAALETHDHDGGARLADPSAAPGATLATSGGSLPGGVTYSYVVTYVDQYGLESAPSAEVSIATGSLLSTPATPGLNTASGGTLAPGLYQYALTAHDGSGGETPLGPVASITVSDWRTVHVHFVLPAGASGVSVWRQGPTESYFTRIATNVSTTPHVDDGSVAADPCACDPENLPPSTNTSASSNKITITAPTGDLVEPTQARRWRIYRTTSAGVYGGYSLLADIADTVADPPVTQLVESYVDDGTTPLTAGTPPSSSTTLEPSAPIDQSALVTTVTTAATVPAASLPVVLANASSAPFTVTLPAVAAGKVAVVKKVDSTANAVTVAPASGTIDGLASLSLTREGQVFAVVCDGTNWFVLYRFDGTKGVRLATRTVTTTPVTVDSAGADHVLLCVPAANMTVNLPAGKVGRELVVKKANSNAFTVTIVPASGTIDGAANLVLSAAWSKTRLVHDGTNWLTI